MMTTEKKKTGLYIHIPFCKSKCNYCDFCSFSNMEKSERAEYITALKREIQSYKRDERYPISTVFFGGGTPSLLEPDEFLDIASALTEVFDFDGLEEYTVEVNPKTLTAEKLTAYRKCGVNRISIGVQSIHKNELKILGRIHTFEDFLTTYQMVKDAGFDNINIDIMYGIPEQTKKSFSQTLEAITSLCVPHISVYGLIIEDGTPFFRMRNSLALPNEDDEADMFFEASKYLKERGFSHYEISNYAKPGFRSRHNLIYWHNSEYIGIGLAAHSYLNGVRYSNTEKMSEYLSGEFSLYRSIETISSDDAAYEYAMLALRLVTGINLAEYRELFGVDFRIGREEKIAEFERLGLLTSSEEKIALTDKGFYLSNTILSELL